MFYELRAGEKTSMKNACVIVGGMKCWIVTREFFPGAGMQSSQSDKSDESKLIENGSTTNNTTSNGVTKTTNNTNSQGADKDTGSKDEVIATKE